MFELTPEQQDIQQAEGVRREHYWRDAKVLQIFEGTKEVEKAYGVRRQV